MISSKNNEEIELDVNERQSFLRFLNGQSEKRVNLERVLGIGGEGIVLAHKMDTKEHHYKKFWFGKPWAGFIKKKGRDVAIKFVKFEEKDNEDFLGPEIEDENGMVGGINGNGKWVRSQYFDRLDELGDFTAATCTDGGYSRPYIDFGISEIHHKHYYVIGKLIF